ncbi:hypothetical protein [Salimicrobium jeotgali]|uniref:hypothetical protein n=1 Tax=Salimicrobium jeotgali TaxID=1230341 RepID=UPI000C821786|nr:hypothetical protein [Salimicrobium jeotgali]
MRKNINWFIFYFIYLLGAELPFFIILWLRNESNSKSILINLFLITSLLINIFIFSLLYKNVKKRINGKHSSQLKGESFSHISSNKVKENLTDFFAIFLLPFFTFNLSGDVSLHYKILELFFIFFLLTIFLFRTNNIFSNIIIYLIFNVYEVKVPGENLTIISTSSRTELQSENISLVRIFPHFYLFEVNDLKLKKTLLWVLNILIVFFIITVNSLIVMIFDFSLLHFLQNLLPFF